MWTITILQKAMAVIYAVLLIGALISMHLELWSLGTALAFLAVIPALVALMYD
jgi:hypothetical protein